MRALLDTHSFLWFIAGDPKLSLSARELIEDPTTQLVLSIASLWEITIKQGVGKLPLTKSIDYVIEHDVIDNEIELLPIRTEHLVALSDLPLHHRDEFDRLIIAQAIAEDLVVIGTDVAFKSYNVELHW